MLLCEVLKERGLYRDLTQVFIKMTAEVRLGEMVEGRRGEGEEGRMREGAKMLMLMILRIHTCTCTCM